MHIDSPIAAAIPDIERNGPLSRHTGITDLQTAVLHDLDAGNSFSNVKFRPRKILWKFCFAILRMPLSSSMLA